MADPRSLYIIDSEVDAEIKTKCCKLWIVSARRGDTGSEHFKAARHDGCQFVMPPWAFEEMIEPEARQLHGLGDDMVLERYQRFGGSARCVLAVTKSATEPCDYDMAQALNSTDALQSLSISSSLKDLTRTTHMLVKLFPQEGSQYRLLQVNLSSKYVGQELTKRNWASHRSGPWQTTQ